MKLFIVRHGQTVENKEKIVQGQRHGKLSRKGLAQVKKLARRLRKEHFDVIYSSDLKRAKDTCKEIIKFHPLTKVHYVQDIRERGFGIFEGKTRALMDEHIKRYKLNFGKWRPKGGESGLDKQRRVVSFLNKMIRRHPDETVLWVTHGGVKYSAINHAWGLEGNKRKPLNTQNTAVSIIEFDKKKKFKVHLLNCVKHL